MHSQSLRSSDRLVVVSVGTDHHRFDRLMDWLDRWAGTTEFDVQLVVQHGSSRCPAGAIGYPMVTKQQLSDLFAAAHAVVVQGGPGGILDSLRAGRKPIVVPRLGALRECVDDHQVAFSRHMAAQDRILLAESEPDLRTALGAVLAAPDDYRVTTDNSHVHDTVERFSALVEQLVASGPVSRLPRRAAATPMLQRSAR